MTFVVGAADGTGDAPLGVFFARVLEGALLPRVLGRRPWGRLIGFGTVALGRGDFTGGGGT